ncbi:MAG: LysM peptidoglycan-binding domain-containing protein [Microscillaceae bacterium]|jgi:LysM repeat protein|nr:LysM peptidoglycan-binding domain-containing protein [Microscillaceae bacterium]
MKYFLGFLLFGLLWLAPSYPSQSCDPDAWNLNVYAEYSFFQPDSTLMQGYRVTPAFSFNRFFSGYRQYFDSAQEVNLQEWQAYFDNQLTINDLDYLVYKMPLPTVQALARYLQNQENNLADSVKLKSYIPYFRTNPHKIDFFKYLAYAKECEPFNNANYSAWQSDEAFVNEEITYLVPIKMSVYDLAWRYNLVPELICQWNNLPTDTYYLLPNQKILLKYSYKTHIVKAGETLADLSRRYRVDDYQLKRWNGINYFYQDEPPRKIRQQNLTEADILAVGSEITITLNPYRVKNSQLPISEDIYEEKELAGQYFHEVGWRYNLGESELKAYNQIGNARKTYLGQKLKIPHIKIKHRVQTNETTESIAKQYNIYEYDVEKAIRQSRGEVESRPRTYQLRAGQKLLIYKGAKAPRDLLQAGVEGYFATNQPFIRLRYAFQAIRAAHYTRLYERCIQLYDQLVVPLPEVNSIIKYWALEHKGGAYKGLQQNAEANLCFAQVFDKCPTRRFSAYQSFWVDSDKDWQKMLKLCQTNAEKSALYLLRAVDPYSNALEEMKNIYQIEPQSEKLNALLIREINKLEFDLLKSNLDKNLFFPKKYQGIEPSQAYSYLIDLKAFIAQCVQEKKTLQPDLWQLAFYYTDVLAGNKDKARQNFRKLAQKTKNPELARQAQLLDLLLEISQLTKINLKIEDKIWQKIQKFEKPHPRAYYPKFSTQSEIFAELLEFAKRSFNRLYPTAEQGKILLTTPTFTWRELQLNYSFAQVNPLLSLVEKKTKTGFEKYLLKQIGETEEIQKARLYELQGTLYLSDNQELMALASFQKIPQPATYLQRFKRNPFYKIYKRSYDNEDVKKANSLIINKIYITQQIIELKQRIAKQPEKRAEAYFQLGNFYFNTTTYGDFYEVFDPNMSTLGDFGGEYKVWLGYQYLSRKSRTDTELAKEYFEKAMKEAIGNGEMELAAKSCFGVAECENHQFFKDSGFWETINKQSDYKNYDKKIIKELNLRNQTYKTMQLYFRDTQYYQEVRQECKYFNEFVQDLSQKK